MSGTGVKDEILEQKMLLVVSSLRSYQVSGALCQELGAETNAYTLLSHNYLLFFTSLSPIRFEVT